MSRAPKSRPSAAAASTAPNIGCSGGLISVELPDGIAIFSGYDLRAGSIRNARVRIRNGAASDQRACLHELYPSSTLAAGELELSIDDVTGVASEPLYRGEIGALPHAGLDLGVFGPGEERSYRFIVILDPGSVRGAQGRGANATYSWRLSVPSPEPARLT
jgi:hypothetical protein